MKTTEIMTAISYQEESSENSVQKSIEDALKRHLIKRLPEIHSQLCQEARQTGRASCLLQLKIESMPQTMFEFCSENKEAHIC